MVPRSTTAEKHFLQVLFEKATSSTTYFYLAKELESSAPSLLRRLTSFGTKHDLPLHEVAHLARIGYRPTCLHCSSPLTAVVSFKIGFGEFCSRKCSCSSERKALRTKSSNLTKYGVENVGSIPSIQRKRARTMRKLYGTSNAFQSEVIKEKIRETHLRNHGVDHHMKVKSIAEKVSLWTTDPEKIAERTRKQRKTALAKYGVDWASKSDAVKGKVKDWGDSQTQDYWDELSERTSLTRSLKDPKEVARSIHQRLVSRYGRKEVVLRGKTFSYQGYEHHALRFLVEECKVSLRDIKSGPAVPTVSLPGRKYYLPDLLIRFCGGDFLVEVKSTYTAGLYYQPMFDLLKAKAKAVVNTIPYEFLLLIMNSDGSLYSGHIGCNFTQHSLMSS